MTWTYAYTPQIWPSLLTLLFLLAMFFYSFRRRSVPAVLPFMAGCLLSAAWAVGSLLESASVDLGSKIFWVKFQAACQLPAATTATCFVLEYAWPGRWLTRRNLALLSIAPLLVLGLIITDPLHHLMWLSFRLDGPAVTPLLNLGGWITIIYSFGLVILSLTVFTWLFLHSPQHRWPVAIMVAGHIGIRTVYVLEKVSLIKTALPLDLIGLAFIIIMYALALFAFRILDPIPLARQTVIEQLRDGMLVLDPQGRLVSLNPAAEKILGAPLKHVQGRSIVELFPDLTKPGSPIAGAADQSKFVEMTVSLKGEAHSYELDFSPLHDFRSLPVGHLLLLHDVTEQRRSQAQILEQQRALATLSEREHLARELHDGLGQALAAAHLQASSAKLLLNRGETTQVGECLDTLADTTLQAETDMREYLLGAQSVVSAGHPFLVTLQEYVKRFARQYSLPVELSVLPELKGQDLPQTVALQLLRIIQEGLSNIRKHAHASCAQVSLATSGELLQVIISDDGLGFDPSAVVTQPGAGFGLRSIRERAEALGGAVQINSAPGKGTQVAVEIPVKK